MKIRKYIKNISLFLSIFCIFGIIYDNIIRYDPSYEITWIIGIVCLVVWYGIASFDEV